MRFCCDEQYSKGQKLCAVAPAIEFARAPGQRSIYSEGDISEQRDSEEGAGKDELGYSRHNIRPAIEEIVSAYL